MHPHIYLHIHPHIYMDIYIYIYIHPYIRTNVHSCKVCELRRGWHEGNYTEVKGGATPVIYWPSTEPSIKRCTCVNKRRNSGSRYTWYNYITMCHRRLGSVSILVGVGVSWGTRCQRKNQWPTVEQPQPRWGRSAAMVRRTLGQYVAVCPRLHLTSHTQPASTLSRIKCERYIFIKKCIRSFIEVFIMFDYVYAYIFICILWVYYTPFPGLIHFTLDPYLIVLSGK